MATVKKAIKSLLIMLLRCYQCMISAWIGHHCRFYPTCSHYSIEAIQTRGIVKGLWLTACRLCRCQPWCAGGYDPVPCEVKKTHHNV